MGQSELASGLLLHPPVGGGFAEQRWRLFLKALVHRYRSGGTYWTKYYHKRFGANATALPVQSWQIWNEPNLKKYFAPYPSPGKYARLLQISSPAIKGVDRHAQVISAGMPGFGDVTAWSFLATLYKVPGIRAYFDAVALHPYGSTLSRVRQEIQRVRNVMKGRGDGATPLWVDEIAWGSAPPSPPWDQQGPGGPGPVPEARLPAHPQEPDGVEHPAPVLVPLARPEALPRLVHLLRQRGAAEVQPHPEARLKAFRSFSADTIPPVATITAGPLNGELVNDATPTFKFVANQLGSTFQCHFDGGPFIPCSSPFTPLAARSNGPHTFSVRAIDAPGNVSATVSRAFTIDTIPPPTPKIGVSVPGSPANENNPKVKGNAAAGTIVKLYKTPGCTGTPAAMASTAVFGTPGITVSVADNTTTTFRATATDAAGNTSGCSAPLTYVEDSTQP